MPLFFFDVHDGYLDRDEDGLEFAGPETARREGLRAFGEILSEKTDTGTEGPWKMIVRDEHDVIVATLMFSML